MRIVFMGTPDFAVPSLQILLDDGQTLAGVYTQPDKPVGRGYTLQMSPVKRCALDHQIPVFQPRTLRDPDVQAELKNLAPDLVVVVAFGKILPLEVLAIPRLGCVNVHGSLLPRYRGAAPMQRAVMDGATETGVTTMFMAEGLDTGDMIFKEALPLTDEDTFETVHDRLAAAGAMLLRKTVRALEAGTAPRTPQPEEGVSYAAKIENEDCLLDFTLPARILFNRIRGLSPVPLAYTHTPDGKRLKIVKARLLPPSDAEPGTVVSTGRDGFAVACTDGCLLMEEVIPEGKGRMSGGAFVNGRKIQTGDRL